MGIGNALADSQFYFAFTYSFEKDGSSPSSSPPRNPNPRSLAQSFHRKPSLMCTDGVGHSGSHTPVKCGGPFTVNPGARLIPGVHVPVGDVVAWIS
jgi:hypothetical protein